MLKGYKTWIGLALVAVGYFGLTKYITPDQVDELVKLLTQLVGLGIAVYGNWKSHQKIKELE